MASSFPAQDVTSCPLPKYTKQDETNTSRKSPPESY